MTIGTIHATVATRLAAAAPSIQDAVVDALVAKVLETRKSALLQALDEVSKCDRELNKLRPDMVTYTENGQKASESYSKKVIDDRQRLQARKSKIVQAVELAMETNSNDAWSKLTQLIGNGKADTASADATE